MRQQIIGMCKHIRSHSTGSWKQPQGYDTGIKVYNCVARQKVPLILRHKRLATWYACGPTVYDSTHIGHASCYVKQDILQRILRDYFHINLVTAMNITDIDDKILKKSFESGEDWLQLAKRYENQFWSDLEALNCRSPDIKVRVSEHIDGIVAFIEQLLSKRLAYTTDDGSVYFEVEKCPSYGKLQRLNLEADAEEHSTKKSSADFALWKARTGTSNEPYWPVPWNKSIGGRPGWHIECSSMASHLFGSVIDFHAGGLDLRFPHHENEEAQSCAHHGTEQWVNYWLHTGQLHTQGEQEKMSKSLKNTIGVSELLSKHSSDEFRVFCLLSNYQNQMDFGVGSMEAAAGVLRRLSGFQDDCRAYVTGIRTPSDFSAADVYGKLQETASSIEADLKDNFNTSKSMEHLLDLVGHANRTINLSVDGASLKSTPDLGVIQAVSNFVERNLRLFGVGKTVGTRSESGCDVAAILDGILEVRGQIRERAVSAKDKELFRLCDSIRDMLKNGGITVKDHGRLSSSWSYTKL